MITKDNYEIYFIDFFENNLSEDEITMLHNFLAQHDDLKQEFNEFQNVSLNEFVDEVVNEDFSFLKKTNPINKLNESDYFIGRIEGDLSIEEEKDLDSYLDKNPKRNKAFLLFQKTKLVAPQVIFNDKKSLKKRNVIPLYYYLSGIAAASVVVLFSIQFLFNTNITISYFPREVKPLFVESIDNDINPPHEAIGINKANITPVIIHLEKNSRDLVKMEGINDKELPAINHKAKNLAIVNTGELPSLHVLPEDSTELIPQVAETPVKNKEVLTLGQFATKKVSGFFLGKEKEKITPNDLLASVGVGIEKKEKSIEYDVIEPSKRNEKVVFKLGKLKVVRRKK